jgi:hypothetical protein
MAGEEHLVRSLDFDARHDRSSIPTQDERRKRLGTYLSCLSVTYGRRRSTTAGSSACYQHGRRASVEEGAARRMLIVTFRSSSALNTIARPRVTRARQWPMATINRIRGTTAIQVLGLDQLSSKLVFSRQECGHHRNGVARSVAAVLRPPSRYSNPTSAHPVWLTSLGVSCSAAPRARGAAARRLQ